MKLKCFFIFKILFIFFFLFSCTPTSSEDYQTLATSEILQFVNLLKKINDPSDLKKWQKKVEDHFNKLAKIMINYRTYLEKHPEAPSKRLSKLEDAASLLKKEIYRIYELDGGFDLIEDMQKNAYLKLSLFEHSLTQERIDMFQSKKPLSKG